MSDEQVLSQNDAALAGIYNDLANQLEQSRGTTQGIFSQGSAAVGQDYQAAQDATQAGGNASLNALAGSAQRLGIGDAGLSQAEGNLKGTLSSFLSGLGTMRAARTSAMDTMGTGAGLAGEQRKIAANEAGAQARVRGRQALEGQLAKQHGQEAAAQAQLTLGQLKLELAKEQAAAKTNGMTPYEAASLGLRAHSADQQDIMNALRAAALRQQLGSGTATQRSQAQIDALGKIDQGLGGVDSNGAAIVDEILGHSKNLADAMDTLQSLAAQSRTDKPFATSPGGNKVSLLTPNGNPLNWGALASYVSQYYQAPGLGLDALGLNLSDSTGQGY